MLELKQNPTIADVSNYIKEMVALRGFKDNSDRGKLFAHLLEETGEFASACRKFEKGSETRENMGYEAADVLIFLLHICNNYGIDLEKAFRNKEEINKKRVWN